MNSKRIIRSTVSVLLLLMIVFSTVGCNKTEGGEDVDEKIEQTTPGTPSIGIGRQSQSDNEPIEDPESDSDIVICIDPGHGFMDGGCGEGIEYLGGVLEKEINLIIANMLDEDLRQLGYKTIVTHNGKDIPSWDTNKNDIFSASERAVYVNTLDIDYLVSIHINSNEDSSISGLWICYEQNARKSNDWSGKIAQSISDAIVENQTDVSRIMLKSEYSLALTRETTAAASLIELGFATNPEDAAKLLDPEWQSQIAQSIADGIDDFFKGGDN